MSQSITNKLLLCALAGSFILADPLFAQADKAATTENTSAEKKTMGGEAPAAEKKAKRKGYKGTIDSIDADAKTVTIKKTATSKTFKIADDAKCVTTFNNNATLADLKQGDLVNVRYSEEGGIAVAHRIAHAAKKEAAAGTTD